MEIPMFTTRIVNDILSRRRRRQAMLEIAGLDDHLLRDIGFTRHDLRVRKRTR